MNNQRNEIGLESDKPMLPISAVAEILNLHPRTLRIYDDASILSPSRSPKNRRLYSLNDIEKGKFIQFLTRDLGINLAGIKIILHLLTQQKVKLSDYKDHVNKIAGKLNISSEDQQETRKKLSKRGRKPKQSGR